MQIYFNDNMKRICYVLSIKYILQITGCYFRFREKSECIKSDNEDKALIKLGKENILTLLSRYKIIL